MGRPRVWTSTARGTRVTVPYTRHRRVITASSPEQLAADPPDTPETGRRREEAVEMTLAVNKPQLQVFCRSNTISR